MDLFKIARTIKKIIILFKDFLFSRNWPAIISGLRIILIIVSALLFIAIVVMIIKLVLLPRPGMMKRKYKGSVDTSKKFLKKWTKIEERIKSGQDAEMKLAIIEADKIFDDFLKKCGYFGKDMGERLKKINSSQISNINEIWQAHKVRNNIVHDLNFKVNQSDAEKSVAAYKKALDELEVL